MATGHWFTNRGKLLIIQGQWDDAGAGAIKWGMIKTQTTAVDTAAEVADLNTVADLLATETECDFTNYARAALTRSASSEDDTNDRVNMDASDISITGAGGATNNDIYGVFFYDATTDTNDSTRLLLSVDFLATPQATNGGDLTYQIADLYRAA